MPLNRKDIRNSFLFHIALLLIATLISIPSSSIKQTFVVFGAHSKKPSSVNYKSLKVARNSVPFAGSPGRSKKAQVKKLANKKQSKPAPKKTPPKKSTLPKKKIAQLKKHLEEEVEDYYPTTKQENKVKTKKQSKKQPKKIVKPIEPEAESRDIEKEETEVPQPEVEDVVEKIEEELKEETLKEELKDAVVQAENEMPDDQAPESGPDDQDLANEQFLAESGFAIVGLDDKEQLLVYQKHVQREVIRRWRPPVGVPKGTLCTVFFAIDDDGDITEFKFLKKSGILIYDMSIMREAKNFKFDKCLWNKQFKIDFRQ